jgi:hypothetical protein
VENVVDRYKILTLWKKPELAVQVGEVVRDSLIE